MTKQEFLQQEAQASRRFMNRHANEDFSLEPGSVSYSRIYRCECGFETQSSEAIFDHVCPTTKKEPLP